jgi:NhaC family Na+:H+ antiporter
MSFGAVIQYVGFTDRLVRPLIKRAKSTGALIASVMGTSIGLNVFAGDQYIAIILPAGMYQVEFRKRRLHPETLATAVENSGTVTSPLVPWNSCGAYMSATLGISTFAYFPYCIFNLVNPVLGLIYGFTGFKVAKLQPDESEAAGAAEPGQDGVGSEVVAPALPQERRVPVSK